jgi:hypothetical protein
MRRFRRRRRHRRTNWIPGINFGEAVQRASMVFSSIQGLATTTGISFDLTSATDLASSGGEGSVVVRVVGRLCFFGITRSVTQLPGWLRVALVTRQVSGAVAINNAVPDLFSLAGQAQENILAMYTTYCGTTDYEIVTSEALASGFNSGYIDIDTSAKRRLEEDLALTLTIQGAQTSGGVSAPTGVNCSGYLRVLMQAPHI